MTDTYMIICRDSAYEVAKTVNELVGQGWLPHGDLAMSAVVLPPHSRGPTFPSVELWFAQVMIRLPEPVLFKEMTAVESGLAHSQN